jgi:hypothetical protein
VTQSAAAVRSVGAPPLEKPPEQIVAQRVDKGGIPRGRFSARVFAQEWERAPCALHFKSRQKVIIEERELRCP